jgi:hypothetical protein
MIDVVLFFGLDFDFFVVFQMRGAVFFQNIENLSIFARSRRSVDDEIAHLKYIGG